MAKNVYRTAAGQQVNVDTMRLVNEGVVAVGNMSVNARGDQVAPDGSIIKTRNEVMKEHYNRNIQPVVKYNPNKRRGQAAEPALPDLDNIPPLPEPTPPAPVTLRSRLADSVAIDLVETPPVLNTKNLTRI